MYGDNNKFNYNLICSIDFNSQSYEASILVNNNNTS